jgi:hypothetical protein
VRGGMRRPAPSGGRFSRMAHVAAVRGRDGVSAQDQRFHRGAQVWREQVGAQQVVSRTSGFRDVVLGHFGVLGGC